MNDPIFKLGCRGCYTMNYVNDHGGPTSFFKCLAEDEPDCPCSECLIKSMCQKKYACVEFKTIVEKKVPYIGNEVYHVTDNEGNSHQFLDRLATQLIEEKWKREAAEKKIT